MRFPSSVSGTISWNWHQLGNALASFLLYLGYDPSCRCLGSAWLLCHQKPMRIHQHLLLSLSSFADIGVHNFVQSKRNSPLTCLMTHTPLDSLLATAPVRRSGSPGGRPENSPAFQRRVPDAGEASPEGTAESFPQKALVVINPVLLQQRDEFLLKGHLAVVCRLILNIGHNLFYLRDAHTERPILGLPGKGPQFGKSVMHPLRGTSFDQLHRLGNGHRGRQREQQVNVIFHTSDAEGRNPIFSCNPSKIRPKPRLKRWRYERSSILGAKDTMRERADVGHGRIQPSPLESRNRKCERFNRPFGTFDHVHHDPSVETLGYYQSSLRDKQSDHICDNSERRDAINQAANSIIE